MEPDALPLLRDQENILGIVGCFYFDQLILFLQDNSLQAVLADVLILLHRSFLHHTTTCSHEQIVSLMVFLHWNDRRDLLLRLQLQEIDDGGSAGCTAALRDRISLQAVYTALVSKEHNVIVGLGQQQILNIILIDGLHALDSLTASVLVFKIVHAHTFDIAKLGHSHNRILIRDQIFHGHIELIKTNGGLTVITIFIRNDQNLFADHTQQLFLICKDRF